MDTHSIHISVLDLCEAWRWQTGIMMAFSTSQLSAITQDFARSFKKLRTRLCRGFASAQVTSHGSGRLGLFLRDSDGKLQASTDNPFRSGSQQSARVPLKSQKAVPLNSETAAQVLSGFSGSPRSPRFLIGTVMEGWISWWATQMAT